MSDNRFQKYVTANAPQLVKNDVPEDDPARPNDYQAVRRVRSYAFNDVLFRSHTGAAQALPWAYLRSWLIDETGSRLVMIWPEIEVSLTGRHLGRFEEDLQRRIIAEFRQAKPGLAGSFPADEPVVDTMQLSPVGG